MPMKKLLYFLIVFGFLHAFQFVTEPNEFMSLTDKIIADRYPLEIHETVTEDGYMLSLFRIPHGLKGKETNSKPVYLAHGLFGDAGNFLFTAIYNSSLAYLLADNGYDVWLANSRGSPYSRKHKKLDPSSSYQYWKFSWHEIGVFDHPTNIDYILRKTEKKRLYYVGYSQGTTSFFVMLSEKPEYNKKIKMAVMLAPVGSLRYMEYPLLQFLSDHIKILHGASRLLGLYKFPPQLEIFKHLLAYLCDQMYTSSICKFIYGFEMGSSKFIKTDIIPHLIRATSLVSTMQLVHYGQAIYSGRFKKFNFMKEENLLKYDQVLPPEYNLTNVAIPTAFFYSDTDCISSIRDVKYMCKKILNCLPYLVDTGFTHLDYIASFDVKRVVYADAIKLMNQY